MRFDSASGGVIPALSGQALLALVPDLTKSAEVDVMDFSLLPGPHMTPPRMFELVGFIRSRLDQPEQAGVVVTHGTDTLEECAYLAGLLLHSSKPVVFVGAMRNSSDAGWDGPINLRSALRVAISEEGKGLGVLVVMNQQILSSWDATKMDTDAVGAFEARDLGALGMVERDQVTILRRPTQVSGQYVNASVLEERVEIVKLSAGSNGRVLDFLLENGYRGVILEGLGLGNVPVTAVKSIQRAVQSGVPVVLTSRCPRGRVLDTYAYEGGGHNLRQMGVILGGLLPSHKARLKLMLLLGAGQDLGAIRKAFEEVD